VSPTHPRQKLLFFIDQSLDDAIRAKIWDFVLGLASLQKWVIAPPQLTNRREKDVRGDIVETLGGSLEIYSALRPWKLDRKVDIAHLNEVSGLIEELCRFSRENKLRIAFELDGDSVGFVENGDMDRSLRVGLLGEWKRHLGV
jgi:hypothetical protein